MMFLPKHSIPRFKPMLENWVRSIALAIWSCHGFLLIVIIYWTKFIIIKCFNVTSWGKTLVIIWAMITQSHWTQSHD